MTALEAAGTLLNIAAKIPGPQQEAMKKAAEAFNNFKDSAGRAFDKAGDKLDEWQSALARSKKVAKFEGDIRDLDKKISTAKEKLKDPSLTATKRAQLQADIAQLLRAKANAQAAINSLKGKTVVIRYTATGVNLTTPSRVGGTYTGGTIRGFAGGGNPIPGMSVVGENGPELLELSGGVARVTPAGNTRRRLSQEGSGGLAKVVLEIKSGGSKMDDLLVELLRKYIRVQGGDVQGVLGS